MNDGDGDDDDDNDRWSAVLLYASIVDAFQVKAANSYAKSFNVAFATFYAPAARILSAHGRWIAQLTTNMNYYSPVFNNLGGIFFSLFLSLVLFFFSSKSFVVSVLPEKKFRVYFFFVHSFISILFVLFLFSVRCYSHVSQHMEWGLQVSTQF